jgi:hypothetical protein
MLLVGREHFLTSTKRSHGLTHLHSQIQSLRKRKHLIIVIIIDRALEKFARKTLAGSQEN